MKLILKLEDLALFGLGIYLFSLLDISWWWFLILFLAPDLGMLGYLWGNRWGAVLYNIFHHKGIAILIYLIGIYFENEILQLAGIMLFSHASVDRIFGYGLKYEKGFKFTHLGKIGEK